MKYKPLAIGIDDFKEMIIKDSYYTDKTSMIRLLTDENSKVTLFTRPRRFGKTLNLSMIKYFFEDTRDEAVNEENRRLFDGLDIAAAGEDYTRYMHRKYDEMLADEGYEECWHVGIGFFRKNCRIKIEKHKIEQ